MITKAEIELEQLREEMRRLSDQIKTAQGRNDKAAVTKLLVKFQEHTSRWLVLELGLSGK